MSDTDPGGDIEELLDFLRDERGFDFTGYKRPSLGRRIAKRMSCQRSRMGHREWPGASVARRADSTAPPC